METEFSFLVFHGFLIIRKILGWCAGAQGKHSLWEQATLVASRSPPCRQLLVCGLRNCTSPNVGRWSPSKANSAANPVTVGTTVAEWCPHLPIKFKRTYIKNRIGNEEKKNCICKYWGSWQKTFKGSHYDWLVEKRQAIPVYVVIFRCDGAGTKGKKIGKKFTTWWKPLKAMKTSRWKAKSMNRTQTTEGLGAIVGWTGEAQGICWAMKFLYVILQSRIRGIVCQNLQNTQHQKCILNIIITCQYWLINC